MNEFLAELIGHQSWANSQLANSLRAIPADAHSATLPGTLGGVLETLYHAVQSEGWYCFLLAEGRPGFSWDLSKQPSLDELERRNADLGPSGTRG